MVDLVLDHDIRDWVLLPIILIMVFVTLLRNNIQALMAAEKPPEYETLKHRNTLTRSARMRGNGKFVSPGSFAARKRFLIGYESAELTTRGRKEDAAAKAKRRGALKAKGLPSAQSAGAMNPGNMVDMMKNNVTFMFQNMFMITWINAFFSGFVLVRVPFPLTMKFKVMLQRGIDLATLDPSYTSSLSWYFIVMFGLRAVIELFVGGPGTGVSDEQRMMQMQMGMAGGGQMGFDAKKMFKQEADNVQLAQQKCKLKAVEQSLVDEYSKARR